MVPQDGMNDQGGESDRENIAFIRQMLGELRKVALDEGAEMLSYLIEMAYIEAGDVQSGHRPPSMLQR